ncbi:MAG TPA: iron ABC transporter substrate-binding protein, partial [Cupriavidus sp.]|nr:iron ABC transporter substrate-binding protein [Cupriavidus sp.]
MAGAVMAAGVPSFPARAQPTARVPAGYPSDYIEVIARAQREGSVTVYGSTDLEIAQPLIDAFEARYPGI